MCKIVVEAYSQVVKYRYTNSKHLIMWETKSFGILQTCIGVNNQLSYTFKAVGSSDATGSLLHLDETPCCPRVVTKWQYLTPLE